MLFFKEHNHPDTANQFLLSETHRGLEKDTRYKSKAFQREKLKLLGSMWAMNK